MIAGENQRDSRKLASVLLRPRTSKFVWVRNLISLSLTVKSFVGLCQSPGVSRRFSTVVAQVVAKVRSCRISYGRIDTGQILS
jgi:hypothetical protein